MDTRQQQLITKYNNAKILLEKGKMDYQEWARSNRNKCEHEKWKKVTELVGGIEDIVEQYEKELKAIERQTF